MVFYKYHGAGNDFLIADNRGGDISISPSQVAALCHRRYGVGADGLMLLEQAPGPYAFRMVYFNSDGSGGMMCGNGGRCIVAFAAFCGISSFDFIAADGPHSASILSSDGVSSVVRLGMKDVSGIRFFDSPPLVGAFLDTGTRHFVVPVTGLDSYDVVANGRRLRYDEAFAPVGANVNFIEPRGPVLHVRTYEKGVEDETFACGTGLVASAIANWHMTHPSPASPEPVVVPLRALRDDLSVGFTPTASGAVGVSLVGPAVRVARIEV